MSVTFVFGLCTVGSLLSSVHGYGLGILGGEISIGVGSGQTTAGNGYKRGGIGGGLGAAIGGGISSSLASTSTAASAGVSGGGSHSYEDSISTRNYFGHKSSGSASAGLGLGVGLGLGIGSSVSYGHNRDTFASMGDGFSIDNKHSGVSSIGLHKDIKVKLDIGGLSGSPSFIATSGVGTSSSPDGNGSTRTNVDNSHILSTLGSYGSDHKSGYDSSGSMLSSSSASSSAGALNTGYKTSGSSKKIFNAGVNLSADSTRSTASQPAYTSSSGEKDMRTGTSAFKSGHKTDYTSSSSWSSKSSFSKSHESEYKTSGSGYSSSSGSTLANNNKSTSSLSGAGAENSNVSGHQKSHANGVITYANTTSLEDANSHKSLASNKANSAGTGLGLGVTAQHSFFSKTGTSTKGISASTASSKSHNGSFGSSGTLETGKTNLEAGISGSNSGISKPASHESYDLSKSKGSLGAYGSSEIGVGIGLGVTSSSSGISSVGAGTKPSIDTTSGESSSLFSSSSSDGGHISNAFGNTGSKGVGVSLSVSKGGYGAINNEAGGTASNIHATGSSGILGHIVGLLGGIHKSVHAYSAAGTTLTSHGNAVGDNNLAGSTGASFSRDHQLIGVLDSTSSQSPSSGSTSLSNRSSGDYGGGSSYDGSGSNSFGGYSYGHKSSSVGGLSSGGSISASSGISGGILSAGFGLRR